MNYQKNNDDLQYNFEQVKVYELLLDYNNNLIFANNTKFMEKLGKRLKLSIFFDFR